MAKKYVTPSKLSVFLDNLKNTFATITHKHTLSDISDYKVDGELSSTSTNPVQNKVINEELDAISDAMVALEQEIDGKSDSNHNHDERYYTETEIDTKLSSKSDTTHNHDNKYDAKGSASAVQTNLNTVSDTLSSHADDADIHVTTTNKSNWNSAYTHSTSAHARTDATKVEDSTTNGNIKINGTETNVYSHPNSGVTAGTYKSVTVNAQGHITSGSNPTTLSGYGITDAETKSDASAKLTEAKTYADNAVTKVKNDLLNGAGAAYDTLKELGDLIDDNKDAIDALETVASGKADKTHGHAISDITNLQSTLDGKAASSHGTHVSYSSTAPVMDGAASVGSASTVARSDHKHPTDTSRASKTEFDTHVSDTTAHMTSTQKSQLTTAYNHSQAAHAPSNAQANQNAFSNIAVSGQTTVAADTTTDTLTLAGSNVTITTDATNDKVTFSVADGTTSAKGVVQLTNSTSSTSTTTAATPSSVKSAYDLANTAKTNAAAAQTRADNAYSLADSKAVIKTLTSEDLNNVVKEGFYNSGGGNTVANKPSGVEHFGLYVIHRASGNYYTQILIGNNTKSYRRHCDNGTWGSWSEDKLTDTTYSAAGSSLGLVKTGGDVTISSGVITVNDDSHNHVISNIDNLQSSLDAKQTTITGGATTITSSNLTASRALVSDSSGKVAVSAVTSTELGYLDGVTSAIQTQLDDKADSVHNHMASNITSGTLSSDRLPTVPITKGGTGATDAATARTNLGITPANIGAALDTYYDDTTINIGRKANKNVGSYSLAFGSDVEASANFTQAFGMNSAAKGLASHAEGSNYRENGSLLSARTVTHGGKSYEVLGTTAEGRSSHAEGVQTFALGYASHSEGYTTTACGESAHAEGYNTKASGNWSHAEGGDTVASAIYTHAEGKGTLASSTYQHVQGRYNVEDANGVYLHIVGNGGSNTSRSNAHTLDWDGNAWFKGNVYVGGTSKDNASSLAVVKKVTQAQYDALPSSKNSDGIIYAIIDG